MTSFDLRHQRVVSMEEVEAAQRAGARELLIRAGTAFTPLARDAIAARSFSVKTDSDSVCAPAAGKWDALFNSPEAEALKAEIIRVGAKLWQRQYVDGNGGNISCRLNDETVLCTPTMVSKADLTPEDLCLVDLSGNQLAGGKPRTSEILMHLEIYKAAPEAKAVVHCHPPHATAYAITGVVPPTCIIPEFEVLVGKVAAARYETPGTQKFAETVLPFVKDHNTILLSNHGVVCWADTVTHAEWSAEVLDTYCWTLMLAQQIGPPITYIGPDKAGDLLAIKRRLGLPDARFGASERLSETPAPGCIAVAPEGGSVETKPVARPEIEAIVRAVTDAVMAALEAKSKA